MNTQIKKSQSWKKAYWAIVVIIFTALVLMVNFVINSSKIYVDKTTLINPYYITWKLEKDGSLRLNDPYYLKTDCKFIPENPDKLKMDSSIYNLLIINHSEEKTLRDIQHPYLIWKRANSDTIHILKNNILLNFKIPSMDES